jgi:hypothetical protein
MKKLSMTLSSAEVTLADGKGTVTASVNNASAAAERVVLGAFPANGAQSDTPAASTWATIDRPLRTIAPGATEQYEVSFNTVGAKPGSYPVKLIPYSADEAPEDYADLGHVVQLAVPEPKAAEPKKPFPWWIAIVAAVVVLVGVGVAVFLTTRPPAETPVTLSLSSYSPVRGPAGTSVQLVGRFADPTVVKVGDVQVAATRVSDTEYTVTMPPASQPGVVNFRVESNGEVVGIAFFEYTAPPQPSSGPIEPPVVACFQDPDCVLVESDPLIRIPGGFVPKGGGPVGPDDLVPGDILVPLEPPQLNPLDQ